MTEVAATAEANAVPPSAYYAPLPLWKLYLLLLLTVGIYAIPWFYRAARDVRDATGNRFSPWLWVFAPFLSIWAAIPAYRLSRATDRWEREGAPAREPSSKPGNVAGLMVLFAGLGSVPTLPWWLLVVTLLLLPIPYLVMQGQLNAAKAELPVEQFRTTPNRYTDNQLIMMIVFSILFLAIVAVWLIVRELQQDESVTADMRRSEVFGTVITDPQQRFELQVDVPGWFQVPVGYNSDDGELEFVTDYPDDWAIVFMFDDVNLDTRADNRVNWIRDTFPRAACDEHRTLTPSGDAVVATLECRGGNLIDGFYHFRSRLIDGGEQAVEVFIKLYDTDRQALEGRIEQLELSEGLSLL
ncbi:MAG: hypothetical protein HKN49_09405 [Gammaproteobacteria bacterium]|nr:hypothetical protein [Gammaproteobacteria bacterium]